MKDRRGPGMVTSSEGGDAGFGAEDACWLGSSIDPVAAEIPAYTGENVLAHNETVTTIADRRR